MVGVSDRPSPQQTAPSAYSVYLQNRIALKNDEKSDTYTRSIQLEISIRGSKRFALFFYLETHDGRKFDQFWGVGQCFEILECVFFSSESMLSDFDIFYKKVVFSNFQCI